MLAVFLLVVLSGMNKETGFGRNKCIAIQGIAALYVVLTHIHTFAAYSSPLVWWLYPINEVTILTNGMFFFISGYGLWESSKNKANYLSARSLACRLAKLLIPAYIVYLLYYFVMIYCGQEMSLIKHLLLADVFSWFYFNDVVWFIIELFFLYIIFWIVYSHWTAAIGNRIMFTLIVSWIILAALWGRGYVWYASTLCFLLGIVMSQTNGRLVLAYNTSGWVTVISIFALIPIFILFIRSAEMIGLRNAVYANCSSLLFCIICYLFTYKNSLGNLLSNWLGKFSYEIYLSHMMILKIIDRVDMNDSLKIYATLCITITVAYILSIIDTKFVSVVCRYFSLGRGKDF